jgi:fucose permease
VTRPSPELTAARNSVGVVFAVNGFAMASLVSRIPAIRSGLDLDNTALGLLLLAIAVGSLGALALSGMLVARLGAAYVVRIGAVTSAVGLVVAGVGAGPVSNLPCAAAGLLVYGAGSGAWDVAMNVEAAEIERRLRRTVMPRFHAGWSLGSFAGAGLGVLATRFDVPLAVHVGTVGVAVAAVAIIVAGRFLPVEAPAATAPSAARSARAAWTDPRTIAVGVMVLCFAAAEGAANDWLALAIVDGYAAAPWVGVAGFTTFVAAMTTGRFVGPVLLDRWGRVRVLTAACAVTTVGALLVVGGESLPGGVVVAGAGILLWGLGTSLGFPVGMSAAADDAANAGARVSVVATIGYGAFLTGPPLLGALGDAVGTLPAMLAVPALMVLAMVMVPAAREPHRAPAA